MPKGRPYPTVCQCVCQCPNQVNEDSTRIRMNFGPEYKLEVWINARLCAECEAEVTAPTATTLYG